MATIFTLAAILECDTLTPCIYGAQTKPAGIYGHDFH